MQMDQVICMQVSSRPLRVNEVAFKNDGRMTADFHFIKVDKQTPSLTVKDDDDDDWNFDTEDDFIDSAIKHYVGEGYDCYYFGSGEDGAMKTNKTNITIDGDSFNFYFEKSGSNKGAGLTGEKDDKYYLAGMLQKAGSDEEVTGIKESYSEQW